LHGNEELKKLEEEVIKKRNCKEAKLIEKALNNEDK
jgi:hypothetical protein